MVNRETRGRQKRFHESGADVANEQPPERTLAKARMALEQDGGGTLRRSLVSLEVPSPLRGSGPDIDLKAIIYHKGMLPSEMLERLREERQRIYKLFNTREYEGYLDGFGEQVLSKMEEKEELNREIGPEEAEGIPLGIPQFSAEIYDDGDLSGIATGYIDFFTLIESKVGGRDVYGYGPGLSRRQYLNRLRRLKSVLGSWKALADRIGVNPRSVRRWRSGERNILQSPARQRINRLFRNLVPRKERASRGREESIDYADTSTYDVRRDERIIRHLGLYDVPLTREIS